jgi:hypothetical protein
MPANPLALCVVLRIHISSRRLPTPRRDPHPVVSVAQRKRKLKGAQSGRATAHENARELGRSDLPAVLFDLDGTLIDSVYRHIITWSEALESAGIVFAKWKIHRRVG